MRTPDHESRILPLREIWPGMQLKTVKSPQFPLIETVMMQNYRLEKDGPLQSGFFVLQPGETVPARKARMLSLPLTTQFEPIEVYTVDCLPMGERLAAFADGKSLRYRGDIGHHVMLTVNDKGLHFLDYEWDKSSGDPRLVHFDTPTAENPHPEGVFIYNPPENAFFVPIHRNLMP